MSIGRHVGLAASFAVCSLVVTAARPGVARAQVAESAATKAERKTAREAYDKGTAAFEKGDYVTALDSFVKANALIPSVQAMYWIAQSQDRLGRADAAIEAYEAVTARADFSKLSDDKAAVVRERLAALKPPPAPPAPPPAAPEPVPQPVESPVVEPALAPLPPPPPPTEPPSPPSTSDDLLPKKHSFELGVMAGLLWVSPSHNLVAKGVEQRELDAPTFEIGARAAFFLHPFFGIEADYSHGFAKVEAGDSASLDLVRGHVIGQLASSRVVPFALLGAGIVHQSSDTLGSDADFVLDCGVGLKVMATELLVPRIDFRAEITQKEGGGFTDGVAVHPEVLIGLGFVLGR